MAKRQARCSCRLGCQCDAGSVALAGSGVCVCACGEERTQRKHQRAAGTREGRVEEGDEAGSRAAAA